MNTDCLHCKEEVKPDEPSCEMTVLSDDFKTSEMRLIHRECMLRKVFGSVSHQLGKCSCHGGSEEDPEGMTRREAAKASVHTYEQLNHQKPGIA